MNDYDYIFIASYILKIVYINLRLKIEDMSVSGVVQTKPVVESNEKLLNVWIKDLKNAIVLNDNQLQELNEKYTKYLGKCIADFIQKHQLEKIVALVASHGHTIKHQPHLGITLQIGNLPEIAKIDFSNI